MVYEAAGRGVIALAGGLQVFFGRIYQYAIGAARLLFAVGKYLTGMENRDANWNAAVFAGVLVAFMVIITLGVGW